MLSLFEFGEAQASIIHVIKLDVRMLSLCQSPKSPKEMSSEGEDCDLL